MQTKENIYLTDQNQVKIEIQGVHLNGELLLPHEAKGLVIFSQGNGSGIFGSANQMVAKSLRDKGFGTLLFDPFTKEENMIYENRFNIDLLTSRLLAVTKWAVNGRGLPVGFFGTGTGAASALRVARILDNKVMCVVSRGGRADLAGDALQEIKSPVLLIAGGLDSPIIELNQRAMHEMSGKGMLLIIPGASHLFEEEGKMERVVDATLQWYEAYLKRPVSVISDENSK